MHSVCHYFYANEVANVLLADSADKTCFWHDKPFRQWLYEGANVLENSELWHICVVTEYICEHCSF